jgi:TusA-related sulfurtransferase
MAGEPPPGDAAAVAIEGGDLELGGGLLALVRPALDLLSPGGVLAIASSAASVAEDIGAFCRMDRHEHVASERLDDGRMRHLVRRGPYGVPRGEREWGQRLPLRRGRLMAADVVEAAPWPERADALSGFAPRGARVEPGGPAYPFTLTERDRTAPPDTATLYDQAVAAQWNAQTDIPWDKVAALPAPLEAAVGQVMTFLAENELSALYVPARFLPRIHPAYAEVAQFIATQLADEARHIDVFLKRARAGGGGLGISAVTTSQSLKSLLDLEDFTEAAFLLSVLGEGTFLDLLRFIEDHAPDEATLELTRRARTDEARHVHFGMAHVAHGLARDATLYRRLEAAVRKRAATLAGASGVPAPIQDALVILAARGVDPPSVRRGHEAFRELLVTMHESRMKRLVHAGFSIEQAERLSDLHTPNFM